MNVFEIDDRLQKIVNGNVDEETGEVIFSEETLAEIEALKLKREEFIEYLCLAQKNDEALHQAINNEKKVLMDRDASLVKRMERREDFIKYLLQGNKFVTPKVSATLRTTHDVVKLAKNEKELKAFYIDNKFFDYLTKTEDYKISKTAIKAAINAGEQVPYATLEDSVSITIK